MTSKFTIIKGESMWEEFFDVYFNNIFLSWPYQTEDGAKSFISTSTIS